MSFENSILLDSSEVTENEIASIAIFLFAHRMNPEHVVFTMDTFLTQKVLEDMRRNISTAQIKFDAAISGQFPSWQPEHKIYNTDVLNFWGQFGKNVVFNALKQQHPKTVQDFLIQRRQKDKNFEMPDEDRHHIEIKYAGETGQFHSVCTNIAFEMRDVLDKRFRCRTLDDIVDNDFFYSCNLPNGEQVGFMRYTRLEWIKMAVKLYMHSLEQQINNRYSENIRRIHAEDLFVR